MNSRINRFFTTLFLISYSLFLFGQSDLRLYDWAQHLPYNGGHTVTQSETRVYYGTEYALIGISKADTSDVTFYSKVEGLSDAIPSWIKYHNTLHTLIVGYANGNIDLIDSNGVTNVNDILRNTSIQGDKRINSIYVDHSPSAFLCTPFGLVILNINTGRFESTVFTTSPALSFTVFQNKYYLATENGLYVFDPLSGGIIENINQWQRITAGLLPSYTCQAVSVYENKLYAGITEGSNKKGLYRMENDVLELWYPKEGYTVQFISNEGQNLMVGFSCDNNCIGIVSFFLDSGYWHDNGIYCVGQISYAIEDEIGRIWYADKYPLFRLAPNHFAPCNTLKYNTPYSASVSDLEVKNNALYVATGGVSESYGYTYSRDGFFIYANNTWENYNQFNTPEIDSSGLLNFFRILPDPLSDKVYVGTYWRGILVKEGDSYTIYDTSNSSLEEVVGDPGRVRVTGLAFDDANNLWVSNFLANHPLSVRKKDGSWKNFDFSCSNITSVTQIVIDQRGYKWIGLYSKSGGIIVFDDGGTIDNESDDRCILLGASNTIMPSNSVNCLAVDIEGDIWVGTAEGPVVFDGSADPFNENTNEGSRVKVEQDGVLNYLLGEETIYAIAVDGANRKWFGTGSGVFVQSPAGNEEVVSYTTDNSPLLDNRIIDIAIDHSNGVVYIGTLGGIMSVRTDAIAGGMDHDENAYAFPNPVRPDYDGPIAIRGLARDAVVKITDVNGQIVFETRALGGQAIWDGRDKNGQKAVTGVYMVFSVANSDGYTKPDALVTKILVVN
ncbi:MAG TPA: two-component regulator propeller domain-containing protein [Saprospiraceae bacterium]|nr:two-component regulator propeller domain-containing protein [Saprospiraceae bacterium]